MKFKQTSKSKLKTQAVAQKLIRQHRPEIIKPEVLCIAPFKTGTTWLYYNLAHHPRVWAPPVKELNFLAHGYNYPVHSIKNILFSSHWSFQAIRTLLKYQIKCCLSPSRPDGFFDKNTRWVFNYALSQRSFARYSGLFPVTPKLCIDISPSYYWLPEERIRELQTYNPTTKVIIIIRNPIDRVWSNARKILCKEAGRSVNQVDNSEFIALFDYEYKIWDSYLKTIALWQTYFDDVYVGFYDRLHENPTAFFMSICAFLGIEESAVIEDVDKPMNVGLREPLPLEFREYLYSQYAPEIKKMADSDIEYAHIWLDEYHAVINGKYSST